MRADVFVLAMCGTLAASLALGCGSSPIQTTPGGTGGGGGAIGALGSSPGAGGVTQSIDAGSIGGAIRMNAGAYGGEIKDIVTSVRLVDAEGRIRVEPRDFLRFHYRNLDLPAETIIIGGAFHLRRGAGEEIAGRVREIIETRKEKHPLEFRNAGSVFKNPRDVPAGRLIEKAGLKGTRIGDAQVSEKHGNFIVNRGSATADAILRLVALVQKRVFETTGYALELEVRIIGEP